MFSVGEILLRKAEHRDSFSPEKCVAVTYFSKYKLYGSSDIKEAYLSIITDSSNPINLQTLWRYLTQLEICCGLMNFFL